MEELSTAMKNNDCQGDSLPGVQGDARPEEGLPGEPGTPGPGRSAALARVT